MNWTSNDITCHEGDVDWFDGGVENELGCIDVYCDNTKDDGWFIQFSAIIEGYKYFYNFNQKKKPTCRGLSMMANKWRRSYNKAYKPVAEVCTPKEEKEK